MYRFRNIKVGLALEEEDKTKIRYAGLVSWLNLSEKIIFSHIISREQAPTLLDASALSLIQERTKGRMKELIEKYYDGPSKTRIEYQVSIESPLVVIDVLRRLQEDDVDLLVLGRISSELSEEGTIPVRIARKAGCSILYVPREAQPRTNQPEEIRILVPVDFSENAAEAMRLAVDFAVAHEIPSIYCVHVYDVPLGYYKRGKTYDEFAETMQKNAEKKCEEFRGTIDFKGIYLNPLIVRMDRKPYKTIAETVDEHGIDFVVIGSRSKKATARFLLDSVSEHLIRTTKVPLLSFKKKDKKDMGLFEALMRL